MRREIEKERKVRINGVREGSEREKREEESERN